jgi:hypothetical protein
MSSNRLAELFPDSDFRFHLTLRRGEPGEFFQAWDPSFEVLNERKRWLSDAPGRHVQLRPAGEELLAEFIDLCGRWTVLPATGLASRAIAEKETGRDKLMELGGLLEPDLLFLSPDAEGQFRLHGGVLCFPSGWALDEKLDHTLDFIHGVVPGLNAALGSPINQLLGKLKPGIAFQRDNWGISASAERNQHPSRHIPAPRIPVALNRLWLRVEHQALVALPRSKGLVFGIRIAAHRLDQLTAQPSVVHGLIRALTSMPQPVAEYKRLAEIRDELGEQLRQCVT